MKINTTILTLSIVHLTLLSSCGNKEQTSFTPQITDQIPVTIMSLTKTDVSKEIHTSGQFTTDDETLLSFKTGGILAKVYVKEGDRVKKGQILASLDLTEITVEVNQAKIQLKKANRDYDRIQNLFSDSVSTLEQLQNAKTNVEFLEQNLATLNYNLVYSEIRAYTDGIILKKLSNEGEIVSLGKPILKTSSKGYSDWILRVPVSDDDWANLSLHDESLIDIEALKINKIRGYVFFKSENVDPLSRSFTIDIKIDGIQKLNIGEGMFGKAVIYQSKKHKIWKIPYNALLDGNSNNGFVFVTNDKKTALKIPVIIGEIENNYVEIVDGLNGYNSLVLSGSAFLTHRSFIKILNK